MIHEDGLARMTRALLRSLVLVALAHFSPALASGQVVYEYVYPYNTPDLIENHFIVLDFEGGEARGWYYATSDEFDSAREGYLPGFFVAEMSELRLSEASISFSLTRPERFFTSAVPLEYRDVTSIPVGLIEEWSVPLPVASRAYVGTRSGDEIGLDVAGTPRVFRRREE